MTDAEILQILKFAGLAIGLGSTFWGMATRTTSEDSAGRKRLTPAGHVAIALALGSFVVAGTSQGFELLAKQSADRDAALEKAARLTKAEAQEARDFRNEQRSQRALDLQRQALVEADVRARQAEQLQYRLADRQRLERLEERQAQSGALIAEMSKGLLTLDGMKVSALFEASLEGFPALPFEGKMKDDIQKQNAPADAVLIFSEGPSKKWTHFDFARSSKYAERLPGDFLNYSITQPALLMDFSLPNGRSKALNLLDFDGDKIRIRYLPESRSVTTLLGPMAITWQNWDHRRGPLRSAPEMMGLDVDVRLINVENETDAPSDLRKRMTLKGLLFDIPNFGAMCLVGTAIRPAGVDAFGGKTYKVRIPNGLAPSHDTRVTESASRICGALRGFSSDEA